jgi:hypothetical protein
MLEKEFKYYLDHQKDLLAKYKGRFIVIMNDEVIGDFGTEQEAYDETVKHHKVGTFLIQKCIPGSEGYTQTYHSRVIYKS